MKEKGLDALLVTENYNCSYFSGFHTQLREMDYSHYYLLILPRDDEPVLVGNENMLSGMEKDSCIKDVRSWASRFKRIVGLVEIFKDMGLANGKIGCELGYSQRLEISYNDLLMLMKGLPNAKFVDGTDVFWKLRVIKSEKEIEYIRKACEITSKAFDKFFETVTVGTTEKECAMLMASCMRDAGANEWRIQPDYRYPHIAPGGIWIDEPTDRALQSGDMFWMDASVSYKGYRSDFNGIGAVPPAPSEKQKRANRLLGECTLKCIDRIKPGIRASEPHRWSEEYRKSKYPDLKSGHPGTDGHSLGLTVMEPPFLSTEYSGPLANCIIENNMVLAFEAGALTPYGYFDMEENFVVREDGCEILSKGRREILPDYIHIIR
jgi:Xaa-Pro aminopeptidase